jgi:hypothetical protein
MTGFQDAFWITDFLSFNTFFVCQADELGAAAVLCLFVIL